MKTLLALALLATASAQDFTLSKTSTPDTYQATWSGTWNLQASDNLTTWTKVSGATSPHAISTTTSRKFYRLSAVADTIIENAVIHTVDSAIPSATTLAIKDGTIIALGNTSLTQHLGTGTNVIDAGGRLILPGFQDVHLHAIEAGLNENVALFSQFGSAQDYQFELQDALTNQPGSATDWVSGAGVNMGELLNTLTAEGTTPLAFIDNIIPNRPAVILDDLGHGAWANTKALQALGYDQLSQHPQGGILGLTSGTQPNGTNLDGIVYESASQTMVDASQPATTANLDKAYTNFLTVLPKFAQFGITTISDAGGYWPRGHQDVWTRAETENKLTVRANNALYVYPEKNFASQVASITALRSNDPNKLVRFNQVKIYVDGIISQTTAALLSPYQNGIPTLAGSTGFTYFPTATLNNYAATFDAAGFQLHIHATGDRGTRLALDAIAHAHTTNNSAGARKHRVTHAYLVNTADVPRFNQLGVFADFQLAPSSLTTQNLSDAAYFVGSRADRYLPSRELFDTGADLTISSDFDADELSPFIKLQALITRAPQGSPSVETKIPTLAQAIQLMTLQPAKLLMHDDRTGSLTVGKLADLIILDQNILTIPTGNIANTKVLLTLLGGSEVYRAPTF